MAKVYCPHCGAKNEYNLKKPDKCFACGKSFVSSFSAPTLASKAIVNKGRKPIEPNNVLEDYESDIDYVPSISSLAYDVEYESSGNAVFKGSDFLNISDDEIKSKPKTKKITREKTKKTNLRRKKRDN